MKIYCGIIRDTRCDVYWYDPELKDMEQHVRHTLPPERSLKLRNHSPGGFAWGYHGSGPAQLALALLLDALPGNSDKLADRLYQKFKQNFVSRWPETGWEITQQEISDWVAGVLTSEEIRT